MTQVYNEDHFCIDMIVDIYKTVKPSEISRLAKTELDMDLTPIEISTYLNYVPEDYEKESWTIKSKEIFNENYGYE